MKISIKCNLLALRSWHALHFGFRRKGCWHICGKPCVREFCDCFSKELVDSILVSLSTRQILG